MIPSVAYPTFNFLYKPNCVSIPQCVGTMLRDINISCLAADSIYTLIDSNQTSVSVCLNQLITLFLALSRLNALVVWARKF